MALIAGGIDVSFPALASLSAYATTKFLLDKNYEGNVLLAFVIAIAIGAVLGAFNGYFIGYLNLNAMIVTLGSSKYLPGHHAGYFKSKSASVSSWNEKLWYRCFLTATNKAEWSDFHSSLYLHYSGSCMCSYAFCTALYDLWTWYLRNQAEIHRVHTQLDLM